MKKFLFWAAMMGGTFGAAMAEMPPAEPTHQRPAAEDPANPAAPFVPVVYQSVFADAPTGVETQSVDWKRANAEVGQFKRGHADILKWEEAQPATSSTSPNTHPGMHSHGVKP